MVEKKEKECEVCNQHFGAMTDKQWKHVKHEHETMSERHKKYLQLKNNS